MINYLPSSVVSNNAGAVSQSPANNPANNVGATQPQQGIVVIPGEFDLRPVPPAMTQTQASATGGSAAAKTGYFLNEAFFNSTPTNNGSGANSIVTTYGDGWSGKGYTNLASMGNGIKCYGFTLQYVVTSGGAQDPSGLSTANPTILVSNLVGANQIPYGVPLNAGARNTQYLSGTMTIAYVFWMNSLTQFSYNIPVGDTVTLTVNTQPIV